MADIDVEPPPEARIDQDLAAWNAAQETLSRRYRAADEGMHISELEVKTPVEVKHLLAIGDSWFDYPIQGNSLLSGPSDIKVQLQRICSRVPVIYSTAHRGDASAAAMNLPKQKRIMALLLDKPKWPNGKPDAIMVSAGGNDVAGDNFCIFLDFNDGTAEGLNTQRFAGILAGVEACYRSLFELRDRYAPGVPIYGHCYDFPTPNGVGAPCGYGPWLLPSLQFRNWQAGPGKAIVHEALTRFKAMLDAMAADGRNNFHVVQTQGTLDDKHWANELHPDPTGFEMIAARFAEALELPLAKRRRARTQDASPLKPQATRDGKNRKGKASPAET